MFTIIKDCSPYYIRFRYDRHDEIVDIIQSAEKNNWERPTGYLVEHVPQETCDKVRAVIPIADKLTLNKDFAWHIITKPGIGYLPHKDITYGPYRAYKCALNFAISIKDEECKTRWFTDEELGKNRRSGTPFLRPDYVPGNHPAICEYTMMTGEGVLFNTGIFHSWDNSTSSNTRVILSIRPNDNDLTFEDVKKMLFTSDANDDRIEV